MLLSIFLTVSDSSVFLFIAVMCLVVLAFAIAHHVAFGSENPFFASLMSSWQQLFAFTTAQQTAIMVPSAPRLITTVYFLLWCLISLLLLNLLIAVLSEVFAAKARTQSNELWERNITQLLEEHVSERRAAVLRPTLGARLHHMLCCGAQSGAAADAKSDNEHQQPEDEAGSRTVGGAGMCSRWLCCRRCACSCCRCCARSSELDHGDGSESDGPSSPHAGQLRRFPTAKLPASSGATGLGSPSRRWSMEARYLPANVLLAGRLDASVRDGLRMSGLLGSPSAAAATARSPTSTGGERDAQGRLGGKRTAWPLIRSGSGEQSSSRMLVSGSASPASPVAGMQMQMLDRAGRVAAPANGSVTAPTSGPDVEEAGGAAADSAQVTKNGVVAAGAAGAVGPAVHGGPQIDHDEQDDDSGWDSDTAVAVLKDPGVLVLAALRALSDELHRAAGRNPAAAERVRARIERAESKRAARDAAIFATQLGPRFIALPSARRDADGHVGGEGGADGHHDDENSRRVAAAAFGEDASDSESHASRSRDSDDDDDGDDQDGDTSDGGGAGELSARKRHGQRHGHGHATRAGASRHSGHRRAWANDEGSESDSGDHHGGRGHDKWRPKQRAARGLASELPLQAGGGVDASQLATQIAAMLQLSSNTRGLSAGAGDGAPAELSSRVQQVEIALADIRGLLSTLVQQKTLATAADTSTARPVSSASNPHPVPPLIRQGARQQLLGPHRSGQT